MGLFWKQEGVTRLSLPSSRFLTLACCFGGSSGVPKGFAVVLSSQWGWLVGLACWACDVGRAPGYTNHTSLGPSSPQLGGYSLY